MPLKADVSLTAVGSCLAQPSKAYVHWLASSTLAVPNVTSVVDLGLIDNLVLMQKMHMAGVSLLGDLSLVLLSAAL